MTSGVEVNDVHLLRLKSLKEELVGQSWPVQIGARPHPIEGNRWTRAVK